MWPQDLGQHHLSHSYQCGPQHLCICLKAVSGFDSGGDAVGGDLFDSTACPQCCSSIPSCTEASCNEPTTMVGYMTTASRTTALTYIMLSALTESRPAPLTNTIYMRSTASTTSESDTTSLPYTLVSCSLGSPARQRRRLAAPPHPGRFRGLGGRCCVPRGAAQGHQQDWPAAPPLAAHQVPMRVLPRPHL